MTRRLLVVSLIVALVASAQAMDVGRARTILNTLASDAYEGRRPGHRGGVKTEEYLAENLRVCGVEPGARAGFFQDVPMLVTEEQGAGLTLMDHELGQIPFTLGLDFTVVTHSGSGSIVAPAVLVGYGYVRPDKGRDDYGELDVSGKVVVIVRDVPDGPYDFEEDMSRRFTLKWAKERHAAAVLYYHYPIPINGAAIPADLCDPALPILYVGDRMLKALLDGTGYTIDTYKEKLKEEPLPVDPGKRVWVSTRVRKLPVKSARNVLGIVYGTDPVLKNEIVVVGAHMDHIGKNANGVIYNGADDNASGTALVAEIARSLAANPTRRSVLIAHFTGEEDGLLGSQYFVEHPSIPFGNIVGMIALDMEGMGSGEVVMAGGDMFGPPWDEYVGLLDSTERSHIRFWREGASGAGDHASFMRAGCPTLAFWSRGKHPYYHSYDDDAKWISDSAMAAVGGRAEHFVRFLGNHDGSLAAHADSLRVMARLAVTLDLSGFSVDAQGSVPELSAVTAAWISRDGAASTAEAVRRVAELRYTCDGRGIATATLKDAVHRDRTGQRVVFLGMDDTDLSKRRVPDVQNLARAGLSVIRFSKASPSADPTASSELFRVLRQAGVYALIPFDFTTAARVEKWEEQAVVSGSLTDFASSPASVREGLLSSDALLVLEVADSPTKEQLETVFPARMRRVHVNFGTLPVHRREEHARVVVRTMYEAGFNREEILALIGGNLRRFLK